MAMVTLMQINWNKVFQHGRVYFVGGAKHGSSSTLGSLLAIHHFGEGSQMEKISPVNNIYHVDATLYVENSAPVIKMELAVKSIVGAQRAAKIGSEDATVQRVSAEVGSAHALLLDVNVIQMFAVIAGLVVVTAH